MTPTETAPQETNVQEAPAAPKPRTPGGEYVTTYLKGVGGLDTDWLTESIDDGTIVACPRCHFLFLPGACGVCETVPATRKELLGVPRRPADLEHTSERLRDARAHRARALYDLWTGDRFGAEALCFAYMADSLARLESETQAAEARRPARRPAAENANGVALEVSDEPRPAVSLSSWNGEANIKAMRKALP